MSDSSDSDSDDDERGPSRCVSRLERELSSSR